MKQTIPWKSLTALLCGLLLIFAGMAVAFAEDVPEVPTEEPVVTEEIVTEPETEPETEPVTEPVTEPETEPETEPVTEMTTVPATTAEQIEQTTAYAAYVDPRPDPTDFVPPTIPKTISEKSYTTNYAFGVISWLCVLVGLIVIFAVAVSTKVSGYRANRRV